MIVRENLIINNKDFIKTYSDKDFLIESLDDGYLYSEAIDLAKYNKQYRETDIENVEQM